MDIINEQKIVNNEQDNKLVIKLQFQSTKMQKQTWNNMQTLFTKRFTIQSMENKYFHSVVAIELPEGIWAYVVTLPKLQNLGLKMKQHGEDIIERQKEKL